MKKIPHHLSRSIESSRRRPSPVIALTILRGAKSAGEQILTVVRNPGANLTHPDVVSVPTQRIPDALMASLLSRSEVCDRVKRRRQDHLETLTVFRGRRADSDRDSGHDPVIYSVESLLARKLGMAEVLEKNGLRFQAWPGVLLEGVARYPSLIADSGSESEVQEGSGGAQEAIKMLNIAVRITAGADLFPESTCSYNHIQWSDLAGFRRMITDRDPAAIGLDALRFCVGGLCVSSSDAFLHATRPVKP